MPNLITPKTACLALALFMTVHADNAQPENANQYNGFGLNIGALFFYPAEVNDLIDDIYDDFKSGYYVTSEAGVVPIFTAYPLKAKGVFYLTPYLAFEPYGEMLWANKWIFTAGAANQSAWVHLFFFNAGANCWLRVKPTKTVSFKTGLGGFGGYSVLSVTGDAGRATLTGPGYGANLLAGLDITFSKVAVNIDFVVPVGVITFAERDGGLDIYEEDFSTGTQSPYDSYPERIPLIGFAFRPGVTFRF